MSNITQPKRYTYKQWLYNNPDLEEELVQQMEEEPSSFYMSCPDCQGWGECECDCCGHTHDCETCDGTGEVHPDGLNDVELIVDHEIKILYRTQYDRDTIMWDEYHRSLNQ